MASKCTEQDLTQSQTTVRCEPRHRKKGKAKESAKMSVERARGKKHHKVDARGEAESFLFSYLTYSTTRVHTCATKKQGAKHVTNQSFISETKPAMS